jgi:hypothetical protein
VVGVVDGDLVAEESRRAGTRVGDERLVWRQVQLEVLTQELRQPGFDLFGFGLGSDEPEQVIVGLCRAPDYADSGGRGAGERVCWREDGRHKKFMIA